MNRQSDFEVSRASYGIVFRTNLDDVVVLKRELAEILEHLPETRAIYQRLYAGRLRIVAERAVDEGAQADGDPCERLRDAGGTE